MVGRSTLAVAPVLPAADLVGQPLAAMLSDTCQLMGQGRGTALPRGPVASLGRRVRAFFAANPAAGPVMGALPFDRTADDHLVAPAHLGPAGTDATVRHTADRISWSVREEPPASAYAAAVATALPQLSGRAGDAGLRKIVLARSLLARSGQPIDVAGLLRHLHAADPTVTAFLLPLPAEPDGTPRHLVGATPELLVARTGRAVTSHPLAGSARRSADAAADEAAGLALLRSDKDRREHALAAEFILDELAPFCRSLRAPDGVALRATRSMWHLGTRIVGELRDPDQSAAELAAILHPTPAVCGVPRNLAASLLPELEGMDRGFYAGAVGWCDRAGDGAWHVSIRCAEVAGRQARLFAGAGIVPGSEPDAEVRETAAKFQAMLHALGLGDAAEAGAPAAPTLDPA